jgi:hypothetical protein
MPSYSRSRRRSMDSARCRGKFRRKTPGHPKPSLLAICSAVSGGSSSSTAFRISPFPFISVFFSSAIFSPIARQRSGNSNLIQPAFAYPFCAAMSETGTGHSRASESSNVRFIWKRAHFRGALEGLGCNARTYSFLKTGHRRLLGRRVSVPHSSPRCSVADLASDASHHPS